MVDSPQKNLLNCDFATPSKAVVDCEINAWMETKRKKSIPKFKIKKIFHEKSNSAFTQSTIESLKKRKEELMKSSGKKNQNLLSNRTTEAATTAQDQEKSSIKGNTEKCRKLPFIHINEFVPEDKKQFQKKTMIMPKKELSLTERRKQSVHRFSQLKLKKTLKLKDSLRENMLPSYREVVQQKIGRQNFNELSCLCRKTANILLHMKK